VPCSVLAADGMGIVNWWNDLLDDANGVQARFASHCLPWTTGRRKYFIEPGGVDAFRERDNE